MMKYSLHDYLMALGNISGCHQLPERSFFYKNRQFPVCARCTGVFIGGVIGVALFFFYKLPIWLCVLFCLVLLVDWLIQRIGIKPSTNFRRLLTGIVCGAGIWQLHIRLLIFIYNLLCFVSDKIN